MASSGNPSEDPSSSQQPMTSSSSTSSIKLSVKTGSLLKRGKRAVALYVKEEYSKTSNSKPLNDQLDAVLDPQQPIDDFENIDTCKWLIAGGLTFDEFAKKGKLLFVHITSRVIQQSPMCLSPPPFFSEVEFTDTSPQNPLPPFCRPPHMGIYNSVY